ncbi:unnamed protein product [Zymoseptoria tritici ST99CH_3D7]|uniref:Uncharacterized protein n=1 Tax=Zymoseptoria tritici (strain ST99CH_3D7) TaxID=1276538 RepID=A0A1X7RYK0_ZYMT9|nr:unnamed protein product [Zymoseptoria tritici ST99CH_3D7]
MAATAAPPSTYERAFLDEDDEDEDDGNMPQDEFDGLELWEKEEVLKEREEREERRRLRGFYNALSQPDNNGAVDDATGAAVGGVVEGAAVGSVVKGAAVGGVQGRSDGSAGAAIYVDESAFSHGGHRHRSHFDVVAPPVVKGLRFPSKEAAKAWLYQHSKETG